MCPVPINNTYFTNLRLLYWFMEYQNQSRAYYIFITIKICFSFRKKMHLFHFSRFLNSFVINLLRNNRSIIPLPNGTCKSGFPSDALIPYWIDNYDSYCKSPVSLSNEESQGYLGCIYKDIKTDIRILKENAIIR